MKEGESKEGSSHFDKKTLNLIGHYGMSKNLCDSTWQPQQISDKVILTQDDLTAL